MTNKELRYLIQRIKENKYLTRDETNYIVKALEQKPKWIPVSERLPKKGGCYICTCYNGAIKTVAFFKWQNRLKQWEKTGTRAYWKIIAWMPLPKPYEPQERNDKE